jgi:hypothetical protein
VPVFLHGLGQALPKGSALLVRFNCTVSVGEPLYGKDSHAAFVAELEARLTALAAQERVPGWDCRFRPTAPRTCWCSECLSSSRR